MAGSIGGTGAGAGNHAPPPVPAEGPGKDPKQPGTIRPVPVK